MYSHVVHGPTPCKFGWNTTENNSNNLRCGKAPSSLACEKKAVLPLLRRIGPERCGGFSPPQSYTYSLQKRHAPSALARYKHCKLMAIK